MNPELPDSEEKRLLAALQKGHKEAMGIIFDQYYTDLYHYGRRVCNDPAQVEDSIQELFVQLWQKREEAGKIARLKPYLLGALRNMLLKSLQRQQRQTGLPDNEAQWAHEAELPFEMRWIVEEERADLNPEARITKQKKQGLLSDLLTEIAAAHSLRFKRINQTIIVDAMTAKTEARVLEEMPQQERTVSGQVVDGDDRSPLPGVNILLKGTNSGTTTDFDGNFSIKVPSDQSVLVFSYIGYQTIEIVVGTQTNLAVSLPVDAQALAEVVVIGYGQQDKGDVTGVVAAVDSKNFNKGAILTPDQLINGKVAGVQITSNTGEPGGQSSIRIRGGTSINASNEPLYVIDGVPIDNSAHNPGGFQGGRNPLNSINPNDIETFTVLKDASATAIYGSRGANGVMIITTKKGKAGKLMDVYLNYKKELEGIKSRVDVTAGYSYQDFNSQFPELRAYDLTSDLLGYNSTAPARQLETYNNVLENRLISFFGRANYALTDKYLLTFTLRRDGSSRFGESNRWGMFPSAALAWRLVDEPFMQGMSNLFSDLKVRVGWGITGNQEIGDYRYLPTYTFGDNRSQVQFGNQFITTLRPNGVDPNLKWEETESYNIGLDYGFLKGRLTGSLEYYYKRTNDLLFEVTVPAGAKPDQHHPDQRGLGGKPRDRIWAECRGD